MALDLYTSTDLMALITDPNYDELYPQSIEFWLQFFPKIYTSTAETILFDEVDPQDRRLAPFVSPNVQGKMMRGRGFQTKTFKPAYVKPKHNVDPSRMLTRRPGEPLLGNLSLQARYDAIIADNLAIERTAIRRRWNWMAARAIIDGAVTVSGEYYPTTVVDFARDSSLTVTLSGGATWDNANADVLGSISNVRVQAQALGRTPTNNLIFGLSAWKYFQANAAVQKLLSNQNRFGTSNFAINPMQGGSPVEFQGSITGPGGAALLALWTYSDTYEADDGSVANYMDPTYVVGVGDAIEGVQCFGAIMDNMSLEAVDIFPKMWMQEDPSVTYTMMQSAPLMVPVRPNNTWRMKVASS